MLFVGLFCFRVGWSLFALPLCLKQSLRPRLQIVCTVLSQMPSYEQQIPYRNASHTHLFSPISGFVCECGLLLRIHSEYLPVIFAGQKLLFHNRSSWWFKKKTKTDGWLIRCKFIDSSVSLLCLEMIIAFLTSFATISLDFILVTHDLSNLYTLFIQIFLYSHICQLFL